MTPADNGSTPQQPSTPSSEATTQPIKRESMAVSGTLGTNLPDGVGPPKAPAQRPSVGRVVLYNAVVTDHPYRELVEDPGEDARLEHGEARELLAQLGGSIVRVNADDTCDVFVYPDGIYNVGVVRGVKYGIDPGTWMFPPRV